MRKITCKRSIIAIRELYLIHDRLHILYALRALVSLNMSSTLCPLPGHSPEHGHGSPPTPDGKCGATRLLLVYGKPVHHDFGPGKRGKRLFKTWKVIDMKVNVEVNGMPFEVTPKISLPKLGVVLKGIQCQVSCGEGMQTLKWLALVASQRYALTVPHGRTRSREDSHSKRGFYLPADIRFEVLIKMQLCQFISY